MINDIIEALQHAQDSESIAEKDRLIGWSLENLAELRQTLMTAPPVKKPSKFKRLQLSFQLLIDWITSQF